jgi:hypothetical protein
VTFGVRHAGVMTRHDDMTKTCTLAASAYLSVAMVKQVPLMPQECCCVLQ